MNPASLDDLRAAYARCRARNSAASYEAGALIEALEAENAELRAETEQLGARFAARFEAERDALREQVREQQKLLAAVRKLLRTTYGSKSAFAYHTKEWLAKADRLVKDAQ